MVAAADRRRGRALRRRARRVLSTAVDRTIGMESTAAAVPVGLPETMCAYEASYWFAVPRGLAGHRWSRPGSFVDLGCGKGRALYAASWYPFRAVVGVELDPDLAGAARRNLAAARGPRRLRRAEVVQGDARTVPLPDDLAVAFLFNPFRGEVFRAVAERLRAHATARGTPLRVIYANPVEAVALLDLGFTRLRTTRHCTVFEHSPRAG